MRILMLVARVSLDLLFTHGFPSRGTSAYRCRAPRRDCAGCVT